jgi:hypothetical protein
VTPHTAYPKIKKPTRRAFSSRGIVGYANIYKYRTAARLGPPV